ncbi:MAG TPA: molybdopterin cofactor-binding domain-containing protein, partial [Anaeromyxobacteraceae bacterium]|nr:molybdopterin cofactor-binding domain-containing protein [Anaeromyxobacteraceae bacterium]
MKLGRRQFLKVGAAAGGALLVEVWMPARARGAAPAGGAPFAPSAVLRVGPEGVTFVCPRAEMGQGVATGLAMLVAEELEFDPAEMRVEAAPADRAYDNPAFRLQLTGGSTSIAAEYEPMRVAGATAREMLVAAAARRWGVAAGACTASGGAVTGPGGKRATYGELAAEAARSDVPRRPKLKESGFRVIGKPIRRVDARSRIDGTGVYGMDVRLPGMLVAAVVRCPVPGGKEKSFDAARAKAMHGVVDVIAIPPGIAVLARDTWSARQAADAVQVTWDEGANAGLDSGGLLASYRAAA